MNGRPELAAGIDLFVEGHIPREDAERQMATACEVLARLESQPGVILADEVGMGKTFVALAVGVTIARRDPERRPVVVMTPPALQAKWPRDADTFVARCLPPALRDEVRHASARSAVEFLKLLDDPADRRRTLIFLSFGTMIPTGR